MRPPRPSRLSFEVRQRVPTRHRRPSICLVTLTVFSELDAVVRRLALVDAVLELLHRPEDEWHGNWGRASIDVTRSESAPRVPSAAPGRQEIAKDEARAGNGLSLDQARDAPRELDLPPDKLEDAAVKVRERREAEALAKSIFDKQQAS